MKSFLFTTLFLSVGFLFTGVVPAEAKRVELKPVEPVVIGSVRYSAPALPELMGFVVARDRSSGKELWRQRIYRVFMKPFREQDVQWVFIRSLTRHDHSLLITNERGEHFSLDLTNKKVTKRQ